MGGEADGDGDDRGWRSEGPDRLRDWLDAVEVPVGLPDRNALSAKLPDQDALSAKLPDRDALSVESLGENERLDEWNERIDEWHEENEHLVAWTTYVTILFAIVAGGFAVFGVLVRLFGRSVLATPGGVTSVVPGVWEPPLVALVVAVFVGAFLGWHLSDDDRTTYRVAFATMAGSTAVFWPLATVPFVAIATDASVNVGSLLLYAGCAGLVAGLTAVGGVWATRTRAPDGSSVRS